MQAPTGWWIFRSGILWDTVTRQITAIFTDPSGGFLYWMVFGPGGTTLATGDGNGSIYLRDVATHKITATLTNPTIRVLPRWC